MPSDRPSPGSTDARPVLAATLSPLLRAEGAPPVREALAWISRIGYRGVQLSAADPETRPRDLPPSARRDLLASLARVELACSGIDLFIPAEHFQDGAFATRAFEAARDAIGLAADLGRAPVVLPALGGAPAILEALGQEALHRGVRLAMVPGSAPDGASAGAVAEPFGTCIDCAASLAAGERPDATILAFGSSVAAVRVVDLLRSGMRGPIGRRGESRLDVGALRVALDVAAFRGIPVVDARQWIAPAEGLAHSLEAWVAHGP